MPLPVVSPYPVESVPVHILRDHPRNYREHPDAQLAHIEQSLTEHGFYRNIVVARDGTILAGHGVVKAARRMQLASVPVIRLDIAPDSPQALRVLAGDNETGHLADINDRTLLDILRDVKDSDAGLLGTGYDDATYAALCFVTRPPDKMLDKHNNEWVGMPEFEPGDRYPTLVVTFRTVEDRERYCEEFGIGGRVTKRAKHAWSAWWPPQEGIMESEHVGIVEG
jgi:hypothetical protein